MDVPYMATIILFLLLDIYFLANGSPIMTTNGTTVVSGGSITFSCVLPYPAVFGAKFVVSKSDYRCGLNTGSNGECSATGSVCTGNKYTCSGDRTSYTLTLINVTDVMNGWKVFCSDSLYDRNKSEEVQIFIQVPLISVVLSPSGSSITVEVGRSINLTCTTGESRPQSNITWIRNNAIITGTTQSVIKGNNDKFITTGILMETGNKSLHNSRIYCSASNTVDRSPVKSEIKTIDVLYSPTGEPVLTTSKPNYTEGEKIALTCKLSEDGNPPAKWTWTCEGRTIQNNQISNSPGQSVLTFITNRSDNKRKCICRASSTVGSFDKISEGAEIIVTYSPLGKPSLQNPILNYNDTNLAVLTCSLSSNGNPPAVWTWRCGLQVFGSNEISNRDNHATLKFKVNRDYHNAQCTCIASSQIGPYNESATPVTLNIQYAPYSGPIITAIPPGHVYNDSTPVSLMCAVGRSNPKPTLKWICSDLNTETHYETLALNFTVSKTFNAEICHCTAKHIVGNFLQRATITLTVNYAARISFNRLPQIMYEKDSVNVTVDVDGNPSPLLTWENTDNGTIVKNDDNSLRRRYFQIQSTSCLDTATYNVKAYNGYGIMDILTFNLSVLCKPRRDERTKLITEIAVGGDNTFILSLPYLGNPAPDVTWYFRKTRQNEKTVDGEKVKIKLDRKGKVEFTSTLMKTNLSCEDFGFYIAVLTNSEGVSNITYHVFQEEGDTLRKLDKISSNTFSIGTFFGGFACALAITGVVLIALFACRRNRKKNDGNPETSNSMYEEPAKDVTEFHAYSELNLPENDNAYEVSSIPEK